MMDSRTAAAMYQLRKAIEALPNSDHAYDKFTQAVDAIVASEDTPPPSHTDKWEQGL